MCCSKNKGIRVSVSVQTSKRSAKSILKQYLQRWINRNFNSIQNSMSFTKDWVSWNHTFDSYFKIDSLRWARCSASSLEPTAGLRNVLWVNVTTTTRTEAAKRKRNVPRTIIAILRWRLACSKSSAFSTTFCASFTSGFRDRTESFLGAALGLRDFPLLLVLLLLPLPEDTSLCHSLAFIFDILTFATFDNQPF